MDVISSHGPRGASARLLALVCSLAAMLSLAACGPSSSTTGLPQGPVLSVGVATDEPGIGLLHDGAYSGLDVTVARYVAQTLGYGSAQIVFVPVTVGGIADALDSGRADVVVTALPMGTGSNPGYDYAGPYLVASQGLMVRKRDLGSIVDAASLSGRRVCTVAGSGAARGVSSRASTAVVSQRDGYQKCLTALMVGEADAVSGDDAVLAGLVADKGAGLLSMASWRFSRSVHAVAVRSGQSRLVAQIRRALTSMVDDGSWRTAMDELVSSTGYRRGTSIPRPAISSYTE